MTLTFRRDLSGPLSAAQFDGNTDDLNGRIIALEDSPPEAVSIDSISVTGDQMTFTMTDASTLGPFTLPVAFENDRVNWTPLTVYAVNDTFGVAGTFYRVIFAHTSGLTFDPGANDGLGHDFYRAVFSAPSNALPDSGLRGQNLRKASDSNYDTEWGFDDASETTFEPSSSSNLVSDNVADALEELEALIASAVAAVHFDATEITFDPSSASGLISTNVSDALDELATRTVDFTDLTGTISAIQSRPTTVTSLGTTGTVSLDPDLGDVFSITPTGNVTLNAASAPAGAKITLVVTTSGTSSFNITPTTNFKSTGALATGTVSAKTFSINFVGNGTNLVETSRTAAM
jgi:hypothetical protein